MNEYKDLKLTVASSPHVNSPVCNGHGNLFLWLAGIGDDGGVCGWL